MVVCSLEALDFLPLAFFPFSLELEDVEERRSTFLADFSDFGVSDLELSCGADFFGFFFGSKGRGLRWESEGIVAV